MPTSRTKEERKDLFDIMNRCIEEGKKHSTPSEETKLFFKNTDTRLSSVEEAILAFGYQMKQNEKDHTFIMDVVRDQGEKMIGKLTEIATLIAVSNSKGDDREKKITKIEEKILNHEVEFAKITPKQAVDIFSLHFGKERMAVALFFAAMGAIIFILGGTGELVKFIEYLKNFSI